MSDLTNLSREELEKRYLETLASKLEVERTLLKAKAALNEILARLREIMGEE